MSTAVKQKIPEYEVFAIRYASMGRARRDNFIGGDPHDGDMPMDFFVWLLRTENTAILIDTGFTEQTALQRDRELLQCPIEGLRTLGVTAQDIDHVILTHLHYDHAGNLDKLPKALFHLQDDEMDFATGRCMCFKPLRHAYAVEDVVTLVRHVYQDRVVFHAGDESLFAGVELLKIGGHTKGLQAVRVNTQRGWVVLASDASHYYENMAEGRPFPIVYNVADMLSGYAKLCMAAQSEQHIIPGHDPLVMSRYPKHPDDANIAMLHLDPITYR